MEIVIGLGGGGLSARSHNSSSSSHHNQQQKSRRQVPSTTGREQGQPKPKEDFNGCVGDRKKKTKTEEEGGRGNSSSNNNNPRQCTQPTDVRAPCKRLPSLSLNPFQPPAPPRDSSTHGYQPVPCRPYIRSASASSPSIPSSVKQQHPQRQQRYSIINTTDNSNHNYYRHSYNYHHRHSTGTLSSVESGSHTMTTSLADWGGEHGGNGNSAGKVYIFLILGIIIFMSGIIIGGFYLNIQQITTSSDLTEVLPTYVNALSVITIGVCVMFLFWKRWRVFLFVVMVLNLGGFLLCLLTGILTATHILKPVISIIHCDLIKESRLCLCYSPYKRKQLSLEHTEKDPFILTFHGVDDNCQAIRSSLPKMLYVLIAIYVIVTMICVLSYFITYRVYRMKKKKEEDQWDDEMCEHDERQHHSSIDYYHPAHCHDSYNQGPPSPGSPVPLLETVYPRGLSRVMKSSMLRDWFPDFVRKDKLRHLKRSQSFSHRSRNNIVDSSNEVFEDSGSAEVRTLDRGHSSKTSHPPRRTLSETMRPASAGTPESMRTNHKLSKQDRRQRTMTMDNLDNRQLLLIMGLHMRNMQEQHELEIQSMQEQQRRSKTPQPYNPGSKGGYMAGRRAYTPQPAKTQSSSPSIPATCDGRSQLPRRRQLFADMDEAFMPSTSTAKTFAEAMFNDMVNPVNKYNTQEHIELETLPLCNFEGVGDVGVHISKVKQSNSFRVPKTSSDGYDNMNQSLLVDCHKRPSLTRTMSASVPAKNESVYIVPLYEKIDSPEHDIVTSPVYERLVSSPETRALLSPNYPERIFNQAPLPYAIKISSSECLYSKSTKPKESIYGRISKKSDSCDRDSPAKRDSQQSSSKVSKEMSTSGSRKSNTRSGKMATPDSSKQYVHSPEANSKTPSKLEKSDQKESGKKNLKRQDAVDLNATLDSVSSGYSQSQDNSNRGNISGTSTELSPLNTNHNRSNASGTSMDASPDGQPASLNPCNTPIPHPKMLPLTPDLSPTSPEDTSLSPEVHISSHRSNASGISSSYYMPEDQNSMNLGKSFVAPSELTRNITGASADISPEKISSDNVIYSPPKHVGYMVNVIPSVLNNNQGHSTNLSSFQNIPHSPSRHANNQNQIPLPKECYVNNCRSVDASKQVQRCYEEEQYDSAMHGYSTSLSPHRGNVEESLGPREQPYGQYGPYSRNIDGCNVHTSPTKNNNVDSKHKNRSHSNSNYYTTSNNSNRDHEHHQQSKIKPPPPPYQSRSSSSSSTSKASPHKLQAEVRKNPTQGKGNFRVGPEGISYRRKKVEGQDTSYNVESPRSELDVEGHAAKEEFYDVHEEKNRIIAAHNYRNDLKNPHDIVLLRDEANGSDSDALETVI
ncbi:uncharacterized protein LOC115218929 [Octopus sinensis]|uniref:Uncharacterized protein LOC115218929 n=1 Tax=Octopus sinensis TaxID=2607531 RepID=A0A6P7T4K9_9MOLL|nr:uncharacterized protein LOC115218929 [Octopus sinensis]